MAVSNPPISGSIYTTDLEDTDELELKRGGFSIISSVAALSNAGPGGTVTEVDTGTGLTGGPITDDGTISLTDTAVTPATYGDSTHVGAFTVDQQGRITAASSVAVAGALGGTVTSVAAGTGLSASPSPITGAGTLSLATIAGLRLLANVTGGVAVPSANTLSAVLDAMLGSTQGQIAYRNATVWTVLDPGTSGQFLQTAGAAADPTWATVSSPIVSVNDAVSAAGTVQGDATLIASSANTITTCATGAGVRLPVAASAPIGSIVRLLNTTANTCKVWPDSGAAIGGLAADTNDTLGSGDSVTLIRTAALQWRQYA